jgi:diguanylate cyclase (GGDEF)-like protein/PAS domain S-box-containing protein
LSRTAASVVITDTRGVIEYVNPAFCANSGYEAAEVIGKNPRVLTSGTFDPQIYREMWEQISEGKAWRGEFHNRRKDGSFYWESATVAPVLDDNEQITHYVAIKDEISDRKRMEQHLVAAATTDTLTGLSNRAALSNRLSELLADHPHDGSSGLALLFLDLDGFKTINDSLGHDAGDELLKQIAGRLRQVVAGEGRPEATAIARLGGDEFVVLLERVRSVNDATDVADSVLSCLAQPYELNGYDIVSTASIGVVVTGLGQEGDADQAHSATDLLRDGDTAMYEAKLAGRGCYRVFDAEMRRRVRSRLELESDLRRALTDDELHLDYQPIIDLRSGELESVEALIRWRHPQRGLISPAEFIPIAEETGLIHDIGAWVLRTACTQFVHWQNTVRDTAPKSVSVNLSRGQFNRADLTEEVAEILADTGMPADRLHLEITETAVMSDVQHAIAVLGKLKELGIKIDMDDFGTGQSSLACLRELPCDILKIDRAFIAGLEASRDMAAMIQAVIHLAYNLGIAVVAEGIETMDQVVTLQALDCDFGQGFLLSRPVSADQVACFTPSRELLSGTA